MDTIQDEINLEHYWQILKRRWFPATVVFAATVVGTGFWAFNQTPIYEAEGKLRFKGQDSTSALTGLGDELGQLAALEDHGSPIATEIGIIRTVPVIQRTIDELDLRNEEGKRITPPQFLKKLDVEHEGGTDILTVAYQSPDVEKAKEAVDVLMSVYLSEHLLANRAEAAAARQFIEEELPGVEQKARYAEERLRRFKEDYQVVNLEEESSATVMSLKNLQAQRTQVASQLADINAQFATLSHRLRVDPQTALMATAISQSDGIQQVLDAYQQVESELAVERVRFHDQHPNILDLETKRTNLGTLLQERIAASIGVPGFSVDEHLSGLNLQVGEVEAALISDYIRLDAQRQGLASQVAALQRAESWYSERANKLPQIEQMYRELVREVEAAQANYSLLLERLQEAQLAENQNVGNARIIQPAEVLGGPVAPSTKMYLLAGGMLGALLSVGMVLLLEVVDRSIKTVEEAKAYFDLPVLGVIPTFARDTYGKNTFGKNLYLRNASTTTRRAIQSAKTSETGQGDRRHSIDQTTIPELVVCSKKPTLSSEAYRMLGNNLKFLDSDHSPQVIVVTSSVPKEGKSTVSSNLAASLAQTGKTVLLIDADLQNPIQHWVWNFPNLRGLSNVLVGQVSLNDALVTVIPKLRVLPAGVTPPNPAALLDSQRMIKLLQYLRSRYDYVILDTPAFSNGASASILGKISDGTLLVVRPLVANSASVRYVKTLLDRSHQRLLGLVVNSTLPRYEPYGRYLSDEFYVSAQQPPNHALDRAKATLAKRG